MKLIMSYLLSDWYYDSDCHNNNHRHYNDEIGSSNNNNNNNWMTKQQQQQEIQLRHSKQLPNNTSQIQQQINRKLGLLSDEEKQQPPTDNNTKTNNVNKNGILLIDTSPNHDSVMNQHELLKLIKDGMNQPNQEVETQKLMDHEELTIKEKIDLLLSVDQKGYNRTNNNNNNNTNNTNKYNNNLTVIVHIGPQKTGSSILQSFIMEEKILQSLSIQHHYSRVPDINQHVDKSFSACFEHHKRRLNRQLIDTQCHLEVIQQTIQLALEGNNLIITSESLSSKRFNIKKFSHFINMYYNNVYIVLYYRRFFSWIVSLHNQHYKNQDIETRIKLFDYLNNHKMIKNDIYDNIYFIGAIHRYQQYYNIDYQIKYYHLNHLNQPSLMEHFLCTAIPNIDSTCQVTHDIIKENGNIPYSNTGIEYIYEELAYYANEYNLISSDVINHWYNTDSWIKNIAHTAQYHQYYTLNITNSYDFGNNNAIVCPNNNTLQLLWNLTVQAEQEFFPQYYNNTSINDNNNEVLLEYNYYMNNYKFCTINASMILYNNNNRWNEFFTKLSILSVQSPNEYPIILL